MSPLDDSIPFATTVTGDAFPCSRCGMLIWTGADHTCAAFRQVTLPPEQRHGCTHCFCRATPDERVCCNCGGRLALASSR